MGALSDDLLCALDPVHFARVRLAFAADPWQARVLSWGGKRLLLNCARQTGKSTTAAVLALRRALYYPKSLVLLVSPSLRQSAELFRRVTDLMAALAERPMLTEDNRLSRVLGNGSRIVSLPSSEATVRGFSAVDLVIFDEAARVDDALYFGVRPMLAVSGGRLVGMSTPFGKRGWWHTEWIQGGGAWERVQVTGSECPRITAAFLEEERRSLGDWWYRQEYLCEFVEAVDQVFSYDLVMGAISSEVKPLFGSESNA